jgi:hypothetical protein
MLIIVYASNGPDINNKAGVGLYAEETRGTSMDEIECSNIKHRLNWGISQFPSITARGAGIIFDIVDYGLRNIWNEAFLWFCTMSC